MNFRIALFPLLLLLYISPAFCEDPNQSDYSKLILGKWLGPRKYEIYYSDGTWGVQRYEDAPIDKKDRHWKINGDKITLTFPGDHGVDSVTETIYILNSKQFITRDDGYSFVREREQTQKVEQGAAANP